MGLLAGKTLAAAAAPGDTHLTITPPLALGDNPAGQPIQIGSELMMVTGGKRGVLGLARGADSAHLSGVAITELNPFVASPEEGGGAIPDPSAAPDGQVVATLDGALVLTPQRTQLLGPVTIDWDTPGFMAPASDWGPSIFTIPAGSWFQVWGILTETFEPVAGDVIVVGFTPDPTDFPHFIQIAQYTGANAKNDPPTAAAAESPRIPADGTADVLDLSLPRWAFTPDEREVVASYQPANLPQEQGSIDFYAIVLTPA